MKRFILLTCFVLFAGFAFGQQTMKTDYTPAELEGKSVVFHAKLFALKSNQMILMNETQINQLSNLYLEEIKDWKEINHDFKSIGILFLTVEEELLQMFDESQKKKYFSLKPRFEIMAEGDR